LKETHTYYLPLRSSGSNTERVISWRFTAGSKPTLQVQGGNVFAA